MNADQIAISFTARMPITPEEVDQLVQFAAAETRACVGMRRLQLARRAGDAPVAITDFGGLEVAPPGPMLMPFQQRVVEELAELEVKVGRLCMFTGSTAFAAVHWQERNRLLRQLAAMTNYAGVLGERIAQFGKPVPTEDGTWLADRGDLSQQCRPGSDHGANG